MNEPHIEKRAPNRREALVDVNKITGWGGPIISQNFLDPVHPVSIVCSCIADIIIPNDPCLHPERQAFHSVIVSVAIIIYWL